MRLKTRILSFLAIYHSSNKREGREKYPQTWWIVAKLPGWLKRVLQFLCERIGGHEPSTTEWGYGGEEEADSWCRWCNKMVKVPKTSIYFKHPMSKSLMDSVQK